jgi:hypothetical protein
MKPELPVPVRGPFKYVITGSQRLSGQLATNLRNLLFANYLVLGIPVWKCCGSGMFYPGSGSLNFSFQIPDPDLKVFIPHPGSRILLYIKRGMKNKSNLYLAPYGFRRKSY